MFLFPRRPPEGRARPFLLHRTFCFSQERKERRKKAIVLAIAIYLSSALPHKHQKGEFFKKKENFQKKTPVTSASPPPPCWQSALSRRPSSRANLAKVLSLRIGTPTSRVYGGWHGKGRKKAPGPQNTMPETLYW